MKNTALRAIIIALTIIMTISVCGCKKKTDSGVVSATTNITTVMTPLDEMQGYWLSPVEMVIYHFAAGGRLTIYKLSSPTEVSETLDGSYTLVDDSLTMTVDGEVTRARLTTDSTSALILSIGDREYTLTPTRRPET